MYSLQKLEIYGYQQEAVPHTFFQQHEPTDHAAIVFPGLEYTCQGPVLSYPSQELLIRRADVLWVEYDQRPQFATFFPEELQQCCVTDASAAYELLFRHRTYRQITLIGKSLGIAVEPHAQIFDELQGLMRLIFTRQIFCFLGGGTAIRRVDDTGVSVLRNARARLYTARSATVRRSYRRKSSAHDSTTNVCT